MPCKYTSIEGTVHFFLKPLWPIGSNKTGENGWSAASRRYERLRAGQNAGGDRDTDECPIISAQRTTMKAAKAVLDVVAARFDVDDLVRIGLKLRRSQ